ncbi:DISARM system SNF2-like helicase DrmD [Chondromyces crocatus]|uniref:DNA/RNA helicase n=1 Tax=Chondromyces crocatus TaxID=52 RepID=A0A0K1EF92_CHOCO|nr:DISARM system SNF2-like helicase DrmD [Chondromyces crocatus]AKT39362.1 DNA/RNA helicase [Chondromyces crocatus]
MSSQPPSPLDALASREHLIELGTHHVQSDAETLGTIDTLDSPRHFAAYFHAIAWNFVTATRADLFQAPFRLGLELLDHQLTPLAKALSLPRANLLLADDAGLGKTIEAGLIMQELELRQRIAGVLVVCPAARCLHWRKEMERRFGQRFEIMGRAFVARCRQERGVDVNPWSTHDHVIVSYQTLRRPEVREPLLAHLDGRAKKGLLVLDEAHIAAPAWASQYAVDTPITRMIRDALGPRFDDRLFLSATPHNGHANSFSALLAMLDPRRFTRGVPIEAGSKALSAVLVRRLKSDLHHAGKDGFPARTVVRIALQREGDTFHARHIEATPGAAEKRVADVSLGESEAPEIVLARLLAEYADSMRPKRGRGQGVFIKLQRRLLSSIEAFHRALEAHEAAIAVATDAPRPPEGPTRDLRQRMFDLSRAHRHRPDLKVLALLHWIRAEQCAAVALPGVSGSANERPRGTWSDRRVILCTEYGDTLRYLQRALGAAVEGTDRGDERIAVFHSGMRDGARADVQRAFNGDPAEHPVRILIATDAGREGLDLQERCADLFHVDVPWSPARVEQRNRRIDRIGQRAPQVRCHHFVQPERFEDAVLDRIVRSAGPLGAELGSLSEVVTTHMERVLSRGIDRTTAAALDDAERYPEHAETTRRELETQRADLATIERDIDEARRSLEHAREAFAFRGERLRDVIDVGLELSGAPPLTPLDDEREGEAVYALPTLPASFDPLLDSLRRPRRRGEAESAWRECLPRPVVFEALSRMDDGRVHLHLHHPFVQRILGRFLAQGSSAHDLSRVTLVPDDGSDEPRVIAFGRFSLFGPGDTRLHDERVAVAAPFRETRDGDHLVPSTTDEDRRAVERLLRLLTRTTSLPPAPEALTSQLAKGAAKDFATLWPHVHREASARAQAATQRLQARGAREADELRQLLRDQREAIQRQLGHQLDLFFQLDGDSLTRQYEQLESERADMKRRLERIEDEIEREPADLEGLYEVSLTRLTPVGLVYLWPTTRL